MQVNWTASTLQTWTLLMLPQNRKGNEGKEDENEEGEGI
jgi:hypothetical protein